MLCIAICEDDPKEAEHLLELLGRYQVSRPNLVLKLSLFTSADALLEALDDSGAFDLYLLDILMDGTNGIELAQRLRGQGDHGVIVFVTNSPEFALNAFSVHAANYLLKPLDEERLFRCLDESIPPAHTRGGAFIMVQTADASHMVPLSHIVFVECMGHVLYYHLRDGTLLRSRAIRVSFEVALAELLEEGRFLRPHQSFLINAAHISAVTASSFHMADGTTIPIARFRAAEVKKKYMSYLTRLGVF